MSRSEFAEWARGLHALEALELPDDSDDLLFQTIEKPDNGFPIGWFPLPERYVKGVVEVHVHLGRVEIGVLDPHPRDFCLVLKWPESGLAHEMPAIAESLEINEADVSDGEIDCAVLVSVREFLKDREGIAQGFRLPTEPRLQTLESCRVAWPDSHDLLSRVLPVARIGDYRETYVVPWRGPGDPTFGSRSTLGIGHLPDKLVECRPEIVHHVPDDDAPFDGWGRSVYVDPEDVFAGLVVWLERHRVSIALVESLDVRCEFSQVLVRSIDLQPSTRKATEHEA